MPEDVKIMVVGPGYPYRNGPSVFLAHLCNELQSKYNVELINFTTLYPKFLFPGSTQYDNSKGRLVTFPNKRMLSSLNPVTWLTTARYINKKNPDIVVIDWWHPFFGPCMYGLTRFLKKSIRKRVVFITENVISHEANKMDVLLTKTGLTNAACFLALSEAVQKHLQTLFHKKVFRSSLPIYDFYEQPEGNNVSQKELKKQFEFDENNIVFLFFGIVRKYKGLDILLQAMAMLIKEHSNVRLLIAGEFYESDAPYRELIETLGMANAVKIENRYIPNEDVAQYFHASDCVVMPYRSATQSGVLSVAYGFRKPVVVTDVGELAALVEEDKTGFVAKPQDSDSLKTALQNFQHKKSEGFDFKNEIEKFLLQIDEFKKINDTFRDIYEYVNR